MKKYILFTILTLLLSVGLQAQKLTKEEKHAKKEAKKNEPPKKGSVYFTPLPILSNNPSFGFMYGVAASTSAFLGDPADTKISSALLGVTLTTKKQLLITLKSSIFTGKNSFKIDTDWRYLKSSQGTYGLGSGPSNNKLASTGFEYDDHHAFSSPINDVQLLKFNWFRLYQTVSKSIRPNFYLGLGYHLDIISKFEDNLLDLDTVPPSITSFYAYNEEYEFKQDKSTLSGLSFNVIYDTRDNVNSCQKGRFAQMTFRINPHFLGSDKSSTSLWLEYRDYFDLTKNHKNMLVIWTYGSFQTTGSLPYLNLPAIGYDQYSTSGRGYTQGRIRGQNLLYAEIEYRAKIWGPTKNPDLIGLNIFSNFTTASNVDADIHLFNYVDPSIGLGLRFMVNPKARTTLSIDYAHGKHNSSGFYFGLNEYF